jgi:hypothetical protein
MRLSRREEPTLAMPSDPPARRESRMREWIVVGIIALAFGGVIGFATCSGQESRPELTPSSPSAAPAAGGEAH